VTLVLLHLTIQVSIMLVLLVTGNWNIWIWNSFQQRNVCIRFDQNCPVLDACTHTHTRTHAHTHICTQTTPICIILCISCKECLTSGFWWWSTFFSRQNWLTYRYVGSWRSLNDHRRQLVFLTLNSGKRTLICHIPYVTQIGSWIQHKLNGATVLLVWCFMT
jgi:hypothetical protein